MIKLITILTVLELGFEEKEMIENLYEFKIPFKPSMFKLLRKRPKWLVIHHTSEIYDEPSVKIDNDQYQYGHIMNQVLEKKQGDVNYHFVIEKIKGDYVPIVARPLFFECTFPDIHPDINHAAIHIALLGNYTLAIPEKRLYEVLAYKILNPFLKIYSLNTNRVVLHRDISLKKKIECPGLFTKGMIIQSMIRKFVLV